MIKKFRDITVEGVLYGWAVNKTYLKTYLKIWLNKKLIYNDEPRDNNGSLMNVILPNFVSKKIIEITSK